MDSGWVLHDAAVRAELLAVADADELRAIAERALRLTWASDPLAVITPPRTAALAMQVREPACRERFELGDVLATEAEVVFAGARGASIRLGSDRSAALAAAICDAVAAAVRGDGGIGAMIDRHHLDDVIVLTDLADEVVDLCRRTQERLDRAVRNEWSTLAPTTVSFEELA